jgi:spoIIIJ-associated protein
MIDTVPPGNSQSERQAFESLLSTIIASTGLQLEFTCTGCLAPGLAGERLTVEFTGPDTALLTARNGELLNALELVVAEVLRLEDHDRIFFDADSYKADRNRALRLSAEQAIASVRSTGRPYAFRPMTSHERRLLHMVLSESGLPTASSGEKPRRFVVLYPEGYEPAQEAIAAKVPAVPVSDRAHAIRSSFRRR